MAPWTQMGAVSAAWLVVLVALAAPAGADVSGGCDGQATIDGVTYTPANDSSSNPVEIPDADGLVIPWRGSAPFDNNGHSGRLRLHIGPIAIPLDDWADDNGDEPNTSSAQDRYELDDLRERLPFAVRGLYRVSGTHEADGGSCSGFVMLRFGGSPFTSPVAIGAAGLGVLSGAGLVVAARSGRRVMGGAAGVMAALSTALLLQQTSVWPLDNLTVVVLPLVAGLLGVLLARWGPLVPPPPVLDPDTKKMFDEFDADHRALFGPQPPPQVDADQRIDDMFERFDAEQRALFGRQPPSQVDDPDDAVETGVPSGSGDPPFDPMPPVPGSMEDLLRRIAEVVPRAGPDDAQPPGESVDDFLRRLGRALDRAAAEPGTGAGDSVIDDLSPIVVLPGEASPERRPGPVRRPDIIELFKRMDAEAAARGETKRRLEHAEGEKLCTTLMDFLLTEPPSAEPPPPDLDPDVVLNVRFRKLIDDVLERRAAPPPEDSIVDELAPIVVLPDD